jgi:hypothetical protein
MSFQITNTGAEAVQWVEWAIRWMENNPESSDMTRAIQEYEAEQKHKSVPLHRQCALLATEWDAVIQEYNAQRSSLQEVLPMRESSLENGWLSSLKMLDAQYKAQLSVFDEPMPVSHPKLTRQNAFDDYAIPAKVVLVRQTAK